MSEQGMPVAVLDDAPVLDLDLQWVLSMFRDLRSCRPIGMSGYGQIPVTDMRTYFDQMCVPPHMWQEAKLYWVRLDAVELEHYHRKHPVKAATDAKPKSDIKAISK